MESWLESEVIILSLHIFCVVKKNDSTINAAEER